MHINIAGDIMFKRQLTEQELAKLTEELGNLYITEIIDDGKGISVYDCYDICEELSEWLKKHNNDVVEGTVVDYYGDYEGSYRYEFVDGSGDWVSYDASAVCKMSDDELIDELTRRGYHGITKDNCTENRRFSSGEEMLAKIQAGFDLYCPDEELYVFLYNAAGAICYYEIDKEEAADLSLLSRESGEDSWSGFLGVGGKICDDPRDPINPPSLENSNLDFCKKYFRLNWIDINDIF